MDMRALARVTVLDPEGRRVRLSDSWQRRPAVIVWLRHFGCLFCREQAAEMQGALPAIRELGADLVLIGNGGVRAAGWFQQRYAPDVTLYTDPGLASYHAVGARSGVLNTVGPAAWRAGLRALRRGARQTSVKGHPFQQGAVMVIAPPGAVLFSHISRAAGDHPPVQAVLQALRRSQPTAASGF